MVAASFRSLFQGVCDIRVAGGRTGRWPTPEGSMHGQRCSISFMQLVSGTVIGGKIVVSGEPLPEGTAVTILAREASESFEVPPELEADLLESTAQADRGETISADEALRRLRNAS